MTRIAIAALIAAVTAGLGTSVAARPSLSEVPEVTNALITAGMAIELAEHCDDVSVRYVRGLSYLASVRSEARAMGYSDDEIEAFVDNDAQKDRLAAQSRARLADLGVERGNPASYCAVGLAQISRDTSVGQLLR